MKILHLRLANCPYKPAYLGDFFKRISKHGYDTVMIEYEEAFPFQSCPEIPSQCAYAPEEVAAIEKAAAVCNLSTIPRGLSFSHSGNILKHKRYKHLSDGDLDLTNPESLSLMINSGEELLAAHPRSSVIHFGGDEMSGMGQTPAAIKAMLEKGRSGLYVEFVNKLAAHFAVKNVRVAIWSDMLIRYPQAIDNLDKRVVIFYWDYWSYGDRQPFLSIGGGCPDTIILDRPALQGSLKKLYYAMARNGFDEIPCGHLDRFQSYWKLDESRKSAASFPYVKWFKDHGLTAIATCLPYPEKGSFLPNFMEKLSHMRGFSKRLHECGGDGFMACLWQPYWPHLETCMPAFLAALELMESPELDDKSVFKSVSARLGGIWTPSAVEAFMNVGENFEFADLMTPLWSVNNLTKSIPWLDKAGMLDDDIAMAERCLSKAQALLNGEWRQLDACSLERFLLEDIAWRAKCELAVHAGDAQSFKALASEGRMLKSALGEIASQWHESSIVKMLLEARYEPWLLALA